jgi:hypothetical protein
LQVQISDLKAVLEMKRLLLALAITAVVLRVSPAAAILPNGSGLTIDTFPGSGAINGSMFTDAAGTSVKLGTAFMLSGQTGSATAILTSVLRARRSLSGLPS